jgi:hypothetical protein
LNGDGCDRYCRKEAKTLIAVSKEEIEFSNLEVPLAQAQILRNMQLRFPQYPNFQQLPYQLPLAQLQPMIQAQGPVGDTGPAAVAVIGAGAAAGFSWMRRRKK